MKTTITMITTFYQGHQYLPRLVEMLRKNVISLNHKADVEYLIINDSPWETIDLSCFDCQGLNIRVVTNPENYGIHKSRAVGISQATGEYVFILDQDDEIADNYMLSQLEAIGSDDCVVCNGIKELNSGNRNIYKDRIKMSLVNKKCIYLLAANQIVSPGQCLLRKSAIPKAWLVHTQAVNGADDLFLWLLMLDAGIRFRKNFNCLYTHKQVGDNLSNDLQKMCQSDLEMCQLLRKEKLLPEKDIAKRERMCAFMAHCGYRTRPSLKAILLYPDVFLVKLFAYFI